MNHTTTIVKKDFGDCIITAVSLSEKTDLYQGLEIGKIRFHIEAYDLDYEAEYIDDSKLFDYRLLVNLLEVRRAFKSGFNLKESDNVVFENGVFTVNGEKIGF